MGEGESASGLGEATDYSTIPEGIVVTILALQFLIYKNLYNNFNETNTRQNTVTYSLG